MGASLPGIPEGPGANNAALRERTAERLASARERVGGLTAFLGFDGFVDEILQVVDKRQDAENYQRLPTITQLARRIEAAAGKSTNMELVRQTTQFGGSGPLMANALAGFGLKVTCLGAFGYPSLHPAFAGFAKRAEVYSVAEPASTSALEFEDGKIMLCRPESLREVTWQNIKDRFGRDKLAAQLSGADCLGFIDWTMLPSMTELWSSILKELCPGLKGPRRKLFIDLVDPEKRTRKDILEALDLLTAFQRYFDVILGLNEKESLEIADALGLSSEDRSPDGLLRLCQELHARIGIDTVVIHPVAFALASSGDGLAIVKGPLTLKPKITTGAGDHFNAGFCLGRLLGFSASECLLTGVATSGFFVRAASSPGLEDLVKMLRSWPN
jgi:sugar/nucleoside kinase (ribokinase family)